LIQTVAPQKDIRDQRKQVSRMSNDLFLEMADGRSIPQLAFGLYLVKDEECEQVIHDAVKAGYRHFDCASYYGNESAVGRAFVNCGVPRSELFICSKVWNDAQIDGREAVRKSFEQSLKDLQCDYFDLFLVHWPVPGHHVETYKELETLQIQGKVRSLGISNYNEKDYDELMKSGITVPPVLIQIEVSPVMFRPDLIAFFKNKNLLVASFKSLNRGGSMNDDKILSLAKKYGVSPAQILLRWNLQHGLVVISKTSNLHRMLENRDILNFNIVQEDFEVLNKMTSCDMIEKRALLEEERKRSI